MSFPKKGREHDNGILDDFKTFRENSWHGIELQDVVKKKTKAVENYRPSRHCRIGFKCQ